MDQDTFDNMVKEYIEIFDMEETEAVSNVIEELKKQGKDLSYIIKIAPGTSIENHELVILTKDIENSNFEDIEIKLNNLVDYLSREGDTDMNKIAILIKYGTFENIIKKLDNFDENVSRKQKIIVLNAMAKILKLKNKFKDIFLEKEIAMKFKELILNLKFEEEYEYIEKIINVIYISTIKHEGNKCKSMELEFGKYLHDYFKTYLQIINKNEYNKIIITMARVITSMTTADDLKASASRAFQHARKLAQDKLHLTLIQIINDSYQHNNVLSHQNIIIPIINAVRSLAATDEICKEISEEGQGIQVFLKLWSLIKISNSNNDLVFAIAQALKQLAHNDDIKREIVTNNGEIIIIKFLENYIQNKDIIKCLLSLITTICLRQPNLALSFVKNDCSEKLILIFKLYKNEYDVLSHACKCIRNLCVRSDEIKALFLKTELEELIRDVKTRCGDQCKDEASAALRDLGLDDY